MIGTGNKHASSWMIYGAYGYTGELIAREAVARGLRPVLAGRSREKLEPLARELSLPLKVFELNDTTQVSDAIAGMDLVLHCAGPFSVTAQPMMEACLREGAHYLDITGEISVFEHAQTLHAQALAAGVVICPGVGFDVVPTDCVAATLKAALPDATHLALGFDSLSRMSPGTAKTSVEGLAQGGKVRIGGQIASVPLAWKRRRINFGDGEKTAMTIPWGDVSTAFQTTAIPNIEVYIPASERMIRSVRMANGIRPLLGLGWVQRWLKARIGKQISGPDDRDRADRGTWVWGEARNVAGKRVEARVHTVNVYSLTVTAALEVVRYLQVNADMSGSYTPARLVGADLVSRLPGSSQIILSEHAVD